jgi:hypothetical protein
MLKCVRNELIRRSIKDFFLLFLLSIKRAPKQKYDWKTQLQSTEIQRLVFSAKEYEIFNIFCAVSKIPKFCCPQIFEKKSGSHLKTQGTKTVTRGKFHIKDPQILGANVRNLVLCVICRPGFMHP